MRVRRLRRRGAPRFSIWLLPPPERARPLAAAVRSLARRHGGPIFRPHVTLLGGIRLPAGDAAARFDRLAEDVRRGGPVRLTVTGAAGEATRFRALYLAVGGGAGLSRARARARRVYRAEAGGTARGSARGGRRARYRPHLSLLYGRLDEGRRRDLARAVGRRFDGTFAAAGLALVRTGRDVGRWRVVRAVRLSAG